MTVAVFGATGQLGALVVDALAERGRAADVLALGRDTGRLQALGDRGFRTASADFDDPGSLRRALEGVDVVLLISASAPGRRVEQHRAAIDAATDAGARRIVYTSLSEAGSSRLVLASEHRETEALLAEAVPAVTLLRNNWYTENHRQDFDRARETGRLANSVGDGRIASATRADYAEATAVVLTNAGHEGRTYELTGDAAWSWGEFAETAAEVLGRDVAYRALTDEEQAVALREAGLDDGRIGFVVALNAGIRHGALARTSTDLRDLIGRPTTPLEVTLRGWR